MKVDLTLKRNDTHTAIKAALKNPTGTVIDLTGATVKFNILKNKTTFLVNREATIEDAVNGKVLFVFAPNETNITGIYKAEFKVAYSDGSIETFPNSGYILIEFKEDLSTQ